ncbi:unnamed protein product [Amoebophrya sp. A25]|nr:unnamed protein product [Amoebophrya sp. A25]|eukprot:GSA25T00025298001.1
MSAASGTWTGGSYTGPVKDAWYEGEGTYKFPNGTIYEGQFRRGEFHGSGTIVYANGGRYKANWNRGVATRGAYIFSDGLQFSDQHWDYLSAKDRRFFIEVKDGLQPAGKTRLTNAGVPMIPEGGYYDCGEGFFAAKESCLYSYEMERIRRVLPEEAEWIKANCRRGFTGSEDPSQVDNEDGQFRDEEEAATKMQALFRGKKARGRKSSQDVVATAETQTANESKTSGSGDKSPSSKDAEKMKIESEQRAEEAHEEVARRKRELEEAERIATEVGAETDEALASIEVSAAAGEKAAGETSDDLEAFAAGLGPDADKAALKMQAKARQRAAKIEVDRRRRELAEAQAAEQLAAKEAKELEEWAETLGDDASAAAVKMQAIQRQRRAKAEVDRRKREKKAREAEMEELRKAREETQANEDQEQKEFEEWKSSLGEEANAAAVRMQAKQRQKAAQKEFQAKKEAQRLEKERQEAEAKAAAEAEAAAEGGKEADAPAEGETKAA